MPPTVSHVEATSNGAVVEVYPEPMTDGHNIGWRINLGPIKLMAIKAIIGLRPL